MSSEEFLKKLEKSDKEKKKIFEDIEIIMKRRLEIKKELSRQEDIITGVLFIAIAISIMLGFVAIGLLLTLLVS